MFDLVARIVAISVAAFYLLYIVLTIKPMRLLNPFLLVRYAILIVSSLLIFKAEVEEVNFAMFNFLNFLRARPAKAGLYLGIFFVVLISCILPIISIYSLMVIIVSLGLLLSGMLHMLSLVMRENVSEKTQSSEPAATATAAA